MRDLEIFDVCHARYCQLRDWLQGRVRGSAGRDAPSDGYRWRPSRTRAEEYIADFEIAGRRMLARPTWKGRLQLFEVYFLQGIEYRRAISLTRVPASTFDWWAWEIKKAVGKELAHRRIFSPGEYFRSSR